MAPGSPKSRQLGSSTRKASLTRRFPKSLAVGLLCLASICDCRAAEPRQDIGGRLLLVHPVDQTAEAASCQSVYEGIVEQLAARGFRVVDKASAEQCSLQIAVTHDIDPELNRTAAFGLKFFAESTIFFRTRTLLKDDDGGTGALVRVNARVVDNTLSQLITAKSAESSSAGLTVEDAREKAGRSAGKKLAAALAGVLEKRKVEGTGSAPYLVVIEGPAGEFDPLELLASLEGAEKVAAVKESESGGGKTSLEISYRGRRDQLDRLVLQTAGKLGWQLVKVRSEGNRSTWKIKTEGVAK